MVAELAADAVAPSTSDNRVTATARFDAFVRAYGIAIPATGISDQDLALYIAYLYEEPTITSSGTIDQYICQGVRIWHHARGLPYRAVGERMPFVQYTLNGAHRRLAASTGSRRKLPLTIEILRRLHAHLDVANPLHVCWWAAATTSFFLLLRKAHIAPAAHRHSDPPSPSPSTRRLPPAPAAVIRHQDLTYDATANRMWVQLNATKTRQPGSGRFELRLPLPAVPNDALCPTTALWDHLRSKGARRPPSEPLFTWLDASGTCRQLTHQLYVSLLKQFLRAVGIEPDQYSGHSFRRGGATFAFSQAGLPQLYIRAMGDWLSDAFLLYCGAQESLRITGANAMAAAVSNAAAAYCAANPQLAR